MDAIPVAASIEMGIETTVTVLEIHATIPAKPTPITPTVVWIPTLLSLITTYLTFLTPVRYRTPCFQSIRRDRAYLILIRIYIH